MTAELMVQNPPSLDSQNGLGSGADQTLNVARQIAVSGATPRSVIVDEHVGALRGDTELRPDGAAVGEVIETRCTVTIDERVELARRS